jgi:glucose-6-phosphate 1-epimerase
MKFSLLALSSLSAAAAFSVSTPRQPSSSTALFGSRRRLKIAARTAWLEKRGAGDSLATTTEGAATSAGLLTNDQGLDYVKLVHPETGASSEIYLYGGVVTSYMADGTELIAVRPDAKMDGSKPISGGLSHCWPQFGPGAIQQHGFA